ncbi:hypothetical protein CFIMG_006085RA [Ceratocystis fimbriata CBS 114723]|uniref:Secreted protein n=1 Tax=Ceratocystis fimbriata CBS 114723 TaxID=1035309 RepID=A0A2C5WVN8_9PEZI|nr:hypothetical protein CFIMG_006085RA [Ceratocystis fimbriata CBS 114723]
MRCAFAKVCVVIPPFVACFHMLHCISFTSSRSTKHKHPRTTQHNTTQHNTQSDTATMAGVHNTHISGRSGLFLWSIERLVEPSSSLARYFWQIVHPCSMLHYYSVYQCFSMSAITSGMYWAITAKRVPDASEAGHKGLPSDDR